MRLRDVERVARRTVPGSGTPRVEQLGSGLLHATYRVDRDGRAFSLRLATRASRASARQAAWLLRLMQMAADQALAPPLIYGDAKRDLVVQRWMTGHAWPPASVRRARNLQRIAQLLRRVHALRAPAHAPRSSPGVWVRHYTQALAAHRQRPDRALAAAAKQQLARLAALPRVAGVVCHSDLHRLNVLEYRPPRSRRAALLLLDWEYAHVAEPFWDLAGWGANNDFSDPLLRRLLAAYLGRAPDDQEWRRGKLLAWLYDYVCLLWSELYLNSPRGASRAAIERRAAVLQVRLSAAGI